MRMLEDDEKEVYNMMMSNVKRKKLRCWKHTAPKGFDKA